MENLLREIEVLNRDLKSKKRKVKECSNWYKKCQL